MADVSIRGVTYTGVAKLDLDKSGGGSAIYYDTENADAAASDLLAGKTAYGASGLITGTRQPPSGSISITENGSVDVTDYATALVNVQGGGGGPTASDAILTVTAPAGSTVTATKGTVTLVPTLWTTAADSTLECALFVIEASQFDGETPWTVTATDGTNTATDIVTIDSSAQYNLDLRFELFFIRAGAFESGFTHAVAGYQATVTELYNSQAVRLFSGATGDRRALLYFTPKISFPGAYRYLVIDYQARGRIDANKEPYFGAVSTLPTGGSLSAFGIAWAASDALLTAATNALSTRAVKALDISGISGDFWVGFTEAGDSSHNGEVLCYNLYLSPTLPT